MLVLRFHAASGDTADDRLVMDSARSVLAKAGRRQAEIDSLISECEKKLAALHKSHSLTRAKAQNPKKISRYARERLKSPNYFRATRVARTEAFRAG